MTPMRDQLDALSREFSLACDAQGAVTWADPRAQRVLGVAAGARLEELAPRGTEEKLRDLLARASSAEVDDWEIPLVASGRPVTVAFRAQGVDGGVLLVGHLVPEHFSRAMVNLGESMEEVVNLNREVVTQKRELQRRNDELVRLNRDLGEMHEGMVTMHSELEDRSVELRNTAEVKARIVSNVSHEFRTPLHSILGLSNLLRAGNDGPLTPEQAKQVDFIRTSTEELMQLVDDMLDLSKSDAGKSTMRMEEFDAADFLGSMRGMLRPLVAPGTPVRLEFDAPDSPISLETDKAKLSQILRNLVSNALKFTEAGEVRVSIRPLEDDQVRVEVRDTGIGIADEDLERIFEEFSQVDSHIQARLKGSGLGLALSRSLASLLGGSLDVKSEPGKGSVFGLTIPRVHPEVDEMEQMVERSRAPAPGRASILVVEDDRKTLFIYEKYLTMAGFHVLPARTIEQARAEIERSRPVAIVLDVMLEGETSWTFLADLKRTKETRDIPVLVVTVTNREQKARALGADEFWLKPVDQDRLLRRLALVARPGITPHILVIDDDERARYIVRKHLEGTTYRLSEAATGPEGIELARTEAPHVILLDFLLEDITAFDVLDELKSDPRTRSIPVIVVTSQALDGTQQKRLLEEAEAVISKQSLSRELALNRIRDALRKSGVAADVS